MAVTFMCVARVEHKQWEGRRKGPGQCLADDALSQSPGTSTRIYMNTDQSAINQNTC